MFPFEVEVEVEEGVGFWMCSPPDTSQQKLGADHLLSNEMGGR